MTKEENYIVFYNPIIAGLWPNIEGTKMPTGWTDSSFEGVLRGVLHLWTF